MWIFDVYGGICLICKMCWRTLLVLCLFYVRALETCSISSMFHQKQGTWHLDVTISLCKWWQNVTFDADSDLSEFLVAFSHFPVLKEYLCANLVLILLCSWDFAAERLPHAWECRSATMGCSSSPLVVEDYLFFDDSLSTRPSLKVILVSISSLPSWRWDMLGHIPIWIGFPLASAKLM